MSQNPYDPDPYRIYRTVIGSNRTVLLDSPGAVAESLFLGYPDLEPEGSGTLIVGAGGDLTVRNLLAGFYYDGSLLVSGGGDVTVAGSGNFGQSIIGHLGADGYVTVTGTGSTYTHSGAQPAYVGSGGNGYLTVSDNAQATFNSGLAVGGSGSFKGTVLVTSGGVLSTTFLREDRSNASVTLDGGTLRALAESSNFLRSFTSGHLILGTAGGVLDTQAFTITAGGPIGGLGALTKTGSGTLMLSGANTYEGGTVFRQGLVRASWDAVFGKAGSQLVFDGGALTLEADMNMTRPLRIDAGGATLSVMGGNPFLGSKVTYSGTITGTGPLTKAGFLHTIQITGNNAGYSGAIHVESGTLLAGGSTALGSGTVTLAYGALLSITNGATVSNAVSLAGNGYISNIGQGTYAGTAALNGRTLTLVGGSTDAGMLTFSGGTAGAGDLALLPNDTQVPANILITGAGLNHSGRIINGGSASATTKIAGAIGPNVTEVVQDSGFSRLVLTGNNLYTGNTTVNSGVLQIGEGGSGGSVKGDIVNNASLVFNRGDTAVHSKAISGSGSVEQAGSGTLVLTGATTWAGSTLISAGTLQFGDGGDLASLPNGAITNRTALIYDHSGAAATAADLTGGGTVTKGGSGALTYSGQSAGQVWSLQGGSLGIGGEAAGLIGLGTAANGSAGRAALTADSGALDVRIGTQGALSGEKGGNAAGSVAAGAAGGAALVYGGQGAVQNAGTVSGGQGGQGGSLQGRGGDGGQAMVFTTEASVINSGVLMGGDGGRSVSPTTRGGAGGAALSLAQGGTVTNTGSIVGGAAGMGLPIADGGVAVASQAGGSWIINSGSIQGGMSILGLRAAAISFSGNNNRLEIHAGAEILGNVLAPGSGDQLLLGGESDGSFPLTLIGQQYVGFETLTKTGGGEWSLTGMPSAPIQAAVIGGTLTLEGTTMLGGVEVGSEGALSGGGTVYGPAAIAGSLTPGGGEHGTLDFRSGLALRTGSLTEIGIGGGDAPLQDHVLTTGALDYGGALVVTFTDGFAPREGDTFQLFEGFTSWTGAFEAITYFTDSPAAPGFARAAAAGGVPFPGIEGTFDYTTGTLTLTAVPEPSAGWLSGLGLLLLVRRGVRK